MTTPQRFLSHSSYLSSQSGLCLFHFNCGTSLLTPSPSPLLLRYGTLTCLQETTLWNNPHLTSAGFGRGRRPKIRHAVLSCNTRGKWQWVKEYKIFDSFPSERSVGILQRRKKPIATRRGKEMPPLGTSCVVRAEFPRRREKHRGKKPCARVATLS